VRAGQREEPARERSRPERGDGQRAGGSQRRGAKMEEARGGRRPQTGSRDGGFQRGEAAREGGAEVG
jgi:hypothetical protein